MSSSSSSDPVAPLVDWWRRARTDLSSSSVRVRADTGTHVFRVGSYSSTVSPGECIESVVRAGGRRWRLLYYPNGATAKEHGKVCVELKLEPSNFFFRMGHCRAEYRVSVLGRDGEPAHSCAVPSDLYFREKQLQELFRSSGVHVVATAAEQSAAVQDDGSLLVRCDVTVRHITQENRLASFFRNRSLYR